VSYSAKVIADSINPFGNRLTTCPGRHGNFVGFKQLRKFYPYEDDYAMVLPQEQSV
jgi:hypothetical protein